MLLRVEEPHREVRENTSIDDEVLAARLGVGKGDRFEEDGDAHAHTYCQGHAELIRIVESEQMRVPGQHQEPLLGEVRGDHLQLVAVARLRIRAPDEVSEGPDALGLQQRGHPPQERLALVESAVLEYADGPREEW